MFLHHDERVDDGLLKLAEQLGKVDENAVAALEVEVDQVFDLFPRRKRLSGVPGVEVAVLAGSTAGRFRSI